MSMVKTDGMKIYSRNTGKKKDTHRTGEREGGRVGEGEGGSTTYLHVFQVSSGSAAKS
jgi:hypothetical protein